MKIKPVMLISGTSRGIGKYLTEYYLKRGFVVIGCSRKPLDYKTGADYHHFCLDITDEVKVKEMFSFIRKKYGKLDVLLNNAGIASMNHSLLMPLETVRRILDTNVVGTFLFSREAAKIMKKNNFGRIVNFASIAVPLKLEGEAVYAASKAAVITLTEITSREYADYGILVNAIAPTPVYTDLVKGVPKEKLDKFLTRQAIHRFATPADISGVIDFLIKKENKMVTGQIIYLGGV